MKIRQINKLLGGSSEDYNVGKIMLIQNFPKLESKIKQRIAGSYKRWGKGSTAIRLMDISKIIGKNVRFKGSHFFSDHAYPIYYKRGWKKGTLKDFKPGYISFRVISFDHTDLNWN